MKSALLIIDVQNGMFTMNPPVHHGEQLLENINKMRDFADKRNIPIIYVQHNGPANSPLEFGSEGWSIHRDISPRNQDTVIQKTTPDSFYKTNLKDHLEKLNVEHLIITGIQTEACVDSTCRSGFGLEYKITLLTDAHSTFDKDYLSAMQIIQHHNEILRWFADTETTFDFMSK
ncbi:cysteine hydrolase family protein [Rossellomorea aquimaris]|uniref:cysteine hydrolase family protein n=1 Tax=Rossellomorea aquimaris TaxID=189382 RepID=UPI0007D0A93F|nr:cysteine hydrolase family protein [Rossellomorea aquimaris]